MYIVYIRSLHVADHVYLCESFCYATGDDDIFKGVQRTMAFLEPLSFENIAQPIDETGLAPKYSLLNGQARLPRVLRLYSICL